jgi:hypothetical protein
MAKLEIISVPPYDDYGYTGDLVVRVVVEEGFYVPEIYFKYVDYYGDECSDTNYTGWRSSGSFETSFSLFRAKSFSTPTLKEERIYNYVELYGAYPSGSGTPTITFGGKTFTNTDSLRFSVPYGEQCLIDVGILDGWRFDHWIFDKGGQEAPITLINKQYSFIPNVNLHNSTYGEFAAYCTKGGGLILHGKQGKILHGKNGTILTDE